MTDNSISGKNTPVHPSNSQSPEQIHHHALSERGRHVPSNSSSVLSGQVSPAFQRLFRQAAAAAPQGKSPAGSRRTGQKRKESGREGERSHFSGIKTVNKNKTAEARNVQKNKGTGFKRLIQGESRAAQGRKSLHQGSCKPRGCLPRDSASRWVTPMRLPLLFPPA